MWDKVISAIPDTLKSIFGLIDKAVPDATKANELKLEAVKIVSGHNSSYWLVANAFTIAMLINYALVMTLCILNREIPQWSLIVALLWLAGPLINMLGKDTVGTVIDMAKDYQKNKKQEGK
jgi:hypothetical protein